MENIRMTKITKQPAAKKIFRVFLLSLLAALALCACGKPAADGSSESADTPSLNASDEALNGSASPGAPDGSLNGDPSSSETADGTAGAGEGSAPGTPGVYADLQDWLAHSGDAVLIAATANHSLASTGITLDISVDGNILVYRFSLPEDSWAQGLSREEFTAAFNPVADSMAATVDDIFSTFAEQYGLSVSAVRFLCFSPDSAELYRRDFLP